MERQIVFRGKRKDNGKWIHGDLQLGDGDHIPMIGVVRGGHDPDYYQVEEVTVGQFTGLRDKDSRPIYEGDIIRTDVGACNFADGACGTVTFLRTVAYDEEKAGFYPFLEEHGMYSHYDWEIIGNIYDRELTYNGKKYKPLLVPNDEKVCDKCHLNGKCHLGFSNYVCEIFDGLQLLDDNKVVILQEIYDTPDLLNGK